MCLFHDTVTYLYIILRELVLLNKIAGKGSSCMCTQCSAPGHEYKSTQEARLYITMLYLGTNEAEERVL